MHLCITIEYVGLEYLMYTAVKDSYAIHMEHGCALTQVKQYLPTYRWVISQSFSSLYVIW